MNDAELKQIFIELISAQAHVGAMVSSLAQSHAALFRLVSGLPGVSSADREHLQDALEKAQPSLRSLQESVERLQQALRNQRSS